MGFVNYERALPKLESDPAVERYFKLAEARAPYVEEISEKTLILRIPSFAYQNKKAIDKVLADNKKQILEKENLIIDLRGNGGGSDASYQEILPYIYTNTIRTIGVEMLSTPLNNQRMLEYSQNEDWPEDDRKWAKESYEKLSKRMGEFVSLNKYPVSTTTFEKVHPYPKQVGVIINENNGSTTEQFLLAAKQSKKVKLFGTTTFGVLDISNMYFAKNPCNTFELGYCLSRSMRIPEMTIDGKGIQPDYYIHKSIPQHDWVDYVLEVLEGESKK